MGGASRMNDSRRRHGRSSRHARDVLGRDGVALLTAAEAAAYDVRAREHAGIPERVLMENAGRAAAHLVHAHYPAGPIVALAGPGNNGGDALVALRALHTWGREVLLVPTGVRPPADELRHEHTIPVATGTAAETALAGASVVLDGILGTGARGAPRGASAEWIVRLTESGRPVVALDLPSGIDATTGDVPGTVVRAELTVTFGWPKLGMLLQPARQQCGRIIAVEIGFPPLSSFGAELITPGWARSRLPARAPDAHKASAGRLLLLAGSSGMAGAAVMAGQAAQRAGAGLVRIASAAGNRTIVQRSMPEATWVDAARLDAAAMQGISALIAGPGLGTTDAARASLQAALELTAGVPTLLDADALNLVAGTDVLRTTAATRPLLITPHPGEMARLLATTAAEVSARPLEAARAAAETFDCTVLLKGQPSIVAQRGVPTLVAAGGSSDLASAGMGDHLAGVAGALLAAGAPPRDAAGVALHYSGRAAVLAGLGRSLSPRDVTRALPRALADPGAELPPAAFPYIVFDQPARW